MPDFPTLKELRDESLPPLNLKRQLARFIRERSLTGAELARRSGVPKQSISDWLAGVRPRNIAQVKRIADTLGVGLTELCFGPEITEASEVRLLEETTVNKAQCTTILDAATDLIFGHTDDLVVYFDTKGIIRKVSRRWTELLGWSQGELLGMNAMGLVHPQDRERLLELARANPTTEPGGPAGTVIRVNDRSGRYVRIRNHFRLLGKNVLAFGQIEEEDARRTG